jgi:pyruvate/2-oxoacid:ferredoxin oxidoreductase beta subunit
VSGEYPKHPMEYELPCGDGSWQHPNDWALRADRMPHIWCAGCGIGIVVNAFINIVMLGFLAANSEIVSTEALCRAIKATMPKGTYKLNLEAFTQGYKYKA